MTRDMIGDDPFPYGIKANRAMLDTITGYSHEQGLTPRKMKVRSYSRKALSTCKPIVSSDRNGRKYDTKRSVFRQLP